MSRHVLFTAVKNEAPFLLEWVAYHKAIGFETIIAFSNASDDGTDELLAALADAGEITHVPHDPPTGVSAQGNAAHLANEMGLFAAGDWILWLDADEFLNVHVGKRRLPDLIAQVGEKQGILIPWRIFGDGGNDRFPGRFIADDFTGACSQRFIPSQEVKTLFRMGPGIAGLGIRGIHRPRLKPEAGLRHQDFLNAEGDTLSTQDPVHGRWFKGQDFPRNNALKRFEFSWKLAQINHYMVRTSEFFMLKQSRGRGWAAAQAGTANERHTPDFYQKMNRNERLDESILHHEAAVDAGIAALRAHPSVAAAEVAAERRTSLALMRAACVRPAMDDGPTDFALTLPPDEADLVSRTYAGAGTILEYGSGGSTLLAVRGAATAQVISVESDPDWALRMTNTLAAEGVSDRARIHFADIGHVVEWGMPKDTAAHRRYHLYASGVWDARWFRQPDVVLIDGRFRVACLITAMLRTTKPLTVLFDDYYDRPYYHWIEDLAPVAERTGRMARFEVQPVARLDGEYLSRIAGAFHDAR